MDNSIKFKNRDPNDFFNQMLAKSFHDGPDFDVDLVLANNRIVSAHRVVLSMYSKFFRSVLSQSEPDTKFIVPLPNITNVVMEKVIEFFYYGEFEANAQLRKKVVDALKFLEVEDLLEPVPPKPKPMPMPMPTFPTSQPKPVPTTTQPKSTAPTTQPKSINSTTQPKSMPPTTQSKAVASNLTATQTNEQISDIQTQQIGDILRPNNNQIAQQLTNPIVTKVGNDLSAEKTAGTDVDATTNAIVAEPTDDEMNHQSKNTSSHQTAEKKSISNKVPALEQLSDENSMVSTADMAEKDAPLIDTNNNIAMFDGKFGTSALNCDADDDDDKWLEKQAQELFDL